MKRYKLVTDIKHNNWPPDRDKIVKLSDGNRVLVGIPIKEIWDGNAVTMLIINSSDRSKNVMNGGDRGEKVEILKPTNSWEYFDEELEKRYYDLESIKSRLNEGYRRFLESIKN